MPELKLSSSHPSPAPPVCMYCGAPADHRQEWDVTNRPTRPGGGTDVIPTPSGDDPVSGLVGCVMLPFVVWDFVTAIARTRREPPAPPQNKAVTTHVTVTTCGRHRRFRDRFVWAGLAMLVALVVLWVFAIRAVRVSMGTEDTALAEFLMLATVGSTILLPLALAFWYTLAGPVIVDRATADGVILDRVRSAYFAATGIPPHDPGEEVR